MSSQQLKNTINDEQRRNLNRPITGIIWKDRIWEQWYSEEAMQSELPHMNQKDYLFSCIGDDPERVIIDNRGLKTYTVRQFQQMVEEYTRAFMAQKLSVGNVICTIGLTTPEMYAIKYSATSLGLITCNLNVFDVGAEDHGINRLYRQMANVKPKMIFILDFLEDKVAAVVNDDCFSETVKVRMPMDASIPGITVEKVGLAFLGMRNRVFRKSVRNAISLRKFLNGKQTVSGEINSVYEPGLPCNIAFTSGTTGVNKAILLSHDANNALAHQHKIGGFGFEQGEKQLALAPPFLAFWDADIVHTVLCMGGVNAIELESTYDKIPGLLAKHKPQVGIMSQFLWDSMLTLPKDQLAEVSANLREAIVGGERCEANQIESFYDQTGVIQMTGFGASEVNTAFTLSHRNCIKIGTSGIPLPFNNVKILDDKGNDVSYGQPGRLYITGPCLMNRYYGMPELTKEVLIPDENGILWYDTRDYAVMDSDGCLTVLDRDQASVPVSYNGMEHMVKLLDVNEWILKNRYVKSSKLNSCDGKIFMYLVIDLLCCQNEKEAVNSVLDTIRTSVPEYSWPNVITILQQLPRTLVGKVEYGKLEKMSSELSAEIKNADKLVVRFANSYQ